LSAEFFSVLLFTVQPAAVCYMKQMAAGILTVLLLRSHPDYNLLPQNSISPSRNATFPRYDWTKLTGRLN